MGVGGGGGGGAGTDILGCWCHMTYYDLIYKGMRALMQSK
jgi:hypothetical protein